MNNFSIWHLALVLIIGFLIFKVWHQIIGNHSKTTDVNLFYSITTYIVAAIHEGKISTNFVINRICDPHRARLPELGIDTEVILRESKVARNRDTLFGLIYFFLFGWFLDNVLLFSLIEEGEISVEIYLLSLLKPLFIVAIISVVKVLIVNKHIRMMLPSLDKPISLDFPENVVVFGGFSPFAGFGTNLDSWSFTIDTKRAATGASEIPDKFSQQELLDSVALSLKLSLTDAITSDLSFISGRKIRKNKHVLTDCTATPINRIPPEDLRANDEKFNEDWRRYRSISVPIANGHLALTFFLRSTNVGRNTFIESRCFVLGPIKAQYTSLNDLPLRAGLNYVFRLFQLKILLAPFTLLSGSSEIFSAALRGFKFFKYAIFGDPENRQKRRDVAYNYGHALSFRESLASDTYQNYFQIIDKDCIAKNVQYITINSIVDFLDSKGVSTDDIKERRTQIFNSGVIVSGGMLNAHQLAVGEGSNAKMTGTLSILKSKGTPNVK